MKPQDNLSTADQGSVDARTSAESVKKQTTSFYRLTASALKEDYKRGLITATGYLYYIVKVSCKDGRSFAIDNRNAFCDEWRLSRGTFYDARAKCVALGLLERMIQDLLKRWSELEPDRCRWIQDDLNDGGGMVTNPVLKNGACRLPDA